MENKETQEALGDFDLKYYSADEIKEKIGSLIPEIIEVSEETEDSEKKAVPKVSSD